MSIQMGQIDPSSNNAMLGVHASASAIIQYGKIARKQGLVNVALDILSRIHTIPTVPIVDCFQKIRQQVKCYLQLAGVMGKNECMQVECQRAPCLPPGWGGSSKDWECPPGDWFRSEGRRCRTFCKHSLSNGKQSFQNKKGKGNHLSIWITFDGLCSAVYWVNVFKERKLKTTRLCMWV